MNKWLDKYVFAQERLRGEVIHRLLGDRLFDREIWHINRRTISGGLALGLFIAFTPTIPFQMLISAICAIWLRVNLPIALAACWITNPFTMIYVYVVEFRIGRFVFSHLPGFLAAGHIKPVGPVRQVFTNAVYVWTGGMILGCIAAVAGYILVRVFWRRPDDQSAALPGCSEETHRGETDRDGRGPDVSGSECRNKNAAAKTNGSPPVPPYAPR